MVKKGKKNKNKVPKNPGSFYELAMRLRKVEEEDLDVSLNRAFLRKDIDQSKKSMELLRKKWKDMTGVKGAENVRDHCLKAWHMFEKAVEKKDLLIAHLQEDLDAVVNIRKQSYKDYIGVIDNSIMSYKTQVEEIYEDFVNHTKQYQSDHREHMEKFDSMRQAAIERLQVALYCIDKKEKDDDQQRKAKLSSKIDELKDQRLEDLRCMNVHEYELEKCFKEMCEVLKHYEEKMAAIRVRGPKYDMEKQEVVCDDKVDFLQLKNRVELLTIENLEKEYKQLRSKWMAYKKKSQSEIKKEEKRMQRMIVESGEAIKELRRVEEKVTSICKLERQCKKLLTAEECENRFRMLDENLNSKYTSNNPNITLEKKMKRFWEMNAECIKLKNSLLYERQVLKAENDKLRQQLMDMKGKCEFDIRAGEV
ncbi:dynein regulatory complex subunit 2 [Nilaparvata lugens]|uniref:dynein regulatory complex subunit 2 n=1 Tax=Nilaparvata lugens TaxID=108931 RepID=UPI00193DCEE2|nr:dynein regulatory complex subunit 2 [Nilaparvata lugens]